MFDTLKEKGLYGLNFYHLSEFISSLQDINSYQTVKEKEIYCLSFMIFYID